MHTYSLISTAVVQSGVMPILELMTSIIKFQKRAARSILDKPIETPSEELFAELKWMTFPERVMYQKAILMYKIMHNLTPAYLTNMFTFSKEVHDRTLRSTADNLLYIPKPNIEHYRNSLAYSGSKIWNSLPNHLRNAVSLQQFRKGILNGQPHKNIFYFRNRTLFLYLFM